jgi:hypothetical protein
VTPPPESWFDRLAAPHTRRQGLRAAALGTAAAIGASLPFVRPLPTASAANPDDCRKGCVYTANQTWSTNRRNRLEGGAILSGLVKIFGPGAALYSLLTAEAVVQALDQDLKEHRQAVNNCFQPYCPGFDAKAPGGPCDGCNPPFSCNPCAVLDNGYICCVYPAGDCHGDCCPTTATQGCE